jgi:TetR/AcrR family transcriptional repressor of nem operon
MDTRTAILEKNFQSIRINGFQGTRTDKVISELGITKGAFYHYFPDKLSMGYAVIDEILYPMFVNAWLHLENYEENMVDALVLSIQKVANTTTKENIAFGCPLNNLIQEMSTLDEVFRKKMMRIIDKEVSLITKAIQIGQMKHQIHEGVNPLNLAYFILASIEGSFAVGKSKIDVAVFQASIEQLLIFLQTLKRC